MAGEAPFHAGAEPELATVEPGRLAETASFPWRHRPDARALRRRGWRWTAWTVAISTPFFVVAGVLIALEPMLFPVSIWSVAHGVAIPALYARRGARSVVPLGSARSAAGREDPDGERTALGLLGDLVGHESG